MYTIVSGKVTTRNIGVAMDITIMVLKTVYRVSMKPWIEFGMTWSIMNMSLENLLRMRPRGVVSKKDIGERSTVSSILL